MGQIKIPKEKPILNEKEMKLLSKMAELIPMYPNPNLALNVFHLVLRNWLELKEKENKEVKIEKALKIIAKENNE